MNFAGIARSEADRMREDLLGPDLLAMSDLQVANLLLTRDRERKESNQEHWRGKKEKKIDKLVETLAERLDRMDEEEKEKFRKALNESVGG